MLNKSGFERDDKVLLRQKYRQLRKKFKSQEGRTVTDALHSNLKKLLTDFSVPEVQVCLYRARRDEAPVNLTPSTKYFFPVLKGEDLEFRSPNTKTAFQANSLNIDEPILEQSSPLDLTKPVIVCCPAVAIDHQGRRLGLGKGYYDRFLAQNPNALRVGVLFHIQISSRPLPAESWDQQMDWIVSEKLVLRVQSKRSSPVWI